MSKKRHTQQAVGIVVLLAVACFIFIILFDRNKRERLDKIEAPSSEILLTYTDGSQIELTKKTKKTLKDDDGKVYATVENGKIRMNPISDTLWAVPIASIATPRGGLFEVDLPDGTHIKLNAASKLTYPKHFDSRKRTVEIDGEALLDVAADTARPFIVSTAREEIELKRTGGRFNVKGYKQDSLTRITPIDQPVIVTLIERDSAFLLRLGQQYVSLADVFRLNNVKADNAIAWQNNRLILDKVSYKEMLKQMERWYDVQVSYDSIPDGLITGEINLDRPLKDFLHMISLTTRLTFDIHERTVRVRN